MYTRGSVVRVGVTLVIVLVLGLPTAAQASAMTVTHSVHVSHFDIHWTCPGRNPVEHAVTTVRITEFWADGVRVRQIEHWHWTGRVENRDTGELLRDDGEMDSRLVLWPERQSRHSAYDIGRGVAAHRAGRGHHRAPNRPSHSYRRRRRIHVRVRRTCGHGAALRVRLSAGLSAPTLRGVTDALKHAGPAIED